MKYYFSFSTEAFYNDDLHPSIPPDAMEITEQLFHQLSRERSTGRKIIKGSDGMPMTTAGLTEDIQWKRSKAWERIKNERIQRMDGGIKVGDNWFHSDGTSRIQHLALKAKAADVMAEGGTDDTVMQIGGQNIMWKTMGGTFVPMTVRLAREIVTTAELLDAQLFRVAEAHRAAMEASADPMAYNFQSGWPLAYGG